MRSLWLYHKAAAALLFLWSTIWPTCKVEQNKWSRHLCREARPAWEWLSHWSSQRRRWSHSFVLHLPHHHHNHWCREACRMKQQNWSSPRRMRRSLDLIIGHFCGVIVSVVTSHPQECYRAWLQPALNPVITQQMWRPQNSHYLIIWSNIQKQRWSLKQHCIRRGIACRSTRKCSRDVADRF